MAHPFLSFRSYDRSKLYVVREERVYTLLVLGRCGLENLTTSVRCRCGKILTSSLQLDYKGV